MMYCCNGFRNFVSCAGERGLAILVTEMHSGHIGFFVQSRGIAVCDEVNIKPIPIDIKINVSAEIGLRYCPTCGRNLADLVEDFPDHFKELAKEHDKFIRRFPK